MGLQVDGCNGRLDYGANRSGQVVAYGNAVFLYFHILKNKKWVAVELNLTPFGTGDGMCTPPSMPQSLIPRLTLKNDVGGCLCWK